MCRTVIKPHETPPNVAKVSETVKTAHRVEVNLEHRVVNGAGYIGHLPGTSDRS